MKKIWMLFTLLLCATALFAEEGYRLWLRYDKISNQTLLSQYRSVIRSMNIVGSSVTLTAAREELQNGLNGLLDTKIISADASSSVLAGTILHLQNIEPTPDKQLLQQAGQEGFVILTRDKNGKKQVIITANTDIGVLYGVFHFLRLLQTGQSIVNLNIVSAPSIKLRLLNHWDNLNRTVERGYAGFSIWNWHTLPDYIDRRYIDYARANASIGINGTVLTNVNANATILTKPYLEKVKALADVFRPYGIKVYLTARFSAPIELGRLKTADPLNDTVQLWWKEKMKEIYSIIPDFGGFLVKANSEGQPGPQDYKRNHADGANMLADAIAPYGGIIMWRAFVYDARAQKSNENFDSSKVDLNAQPIAMNSTPLMESSGKIF
jgi:alpha-glucuronidase